MWQAIQVHLGYGAADFATDSKTVRHAKLIALGLLAERLLLTHRGKYDSPQWTTEEAFVTQVLGPLDERLEPLASDIARIIAEG